MAVNGRGRLLSRRIRCHIFEVEPVQVRELAAPALHRDRPAADRDIMGAGNTAVPARGVGKERPDRPCAGLFEGAGFIDIFQPGHKDPGRPAGSAGNIGPVGHGLDVLVCQPAAVVTVGAVIRADEPVVHDGVIPSGYH